MSMFSDAIASTCTLHPSVLQRDGFRSALPILATS